MARNLTAALLAALQAGTVRPVVFYEGEYSTGTLRLWSGVGPFTWNAQTWTGVGQMLGVAPIEEGSDVRAVGFSVSLSGEASVLLSANLSAARNGLPGRVWIGALDSAGTVIADPFRAFDGRFDVPDIFVEGSACTITARYESRLIDLDRPRERRYTHEDQQIDYPGDRGFEYVPGLQDAQIVWGRGSGALAPASAAAPATADPGYTPEVGGA